MLVALRVKPVALTQYEPDTPTLPGIEKYALDHGVVCVFLHQGVILWFRCDTAHLVKALLHLDFLSPHLDDLLYHALMGVVLGYPESQIMDFLRRIYPQSDASAAITDAHAILASQF